MFFSYNQNIPAANNNPSDDQPRMLTNFNSIYSWAIQDHYGYKDINSRGGIHKYIRMPVNGPPGTAVRESQSASLFSLTATSVGASQEGNFFFVPGKSTNTYQLTRSIDGAYPLFATNTQTFTTTSYSINSGWTFAPGGMLLQYGTITRTPNNALQIGTVVFPVSFVSAPYSLQLTSAFTPPSNVVRTCCYFNLTNTQFQFLTDLPIGWTSIGFTAIGV